VRRSLRAQLTLTLVALTIIPLFLVGGLLAQQGFDVQQQQAMELQREVAERAAVQLTTFLTAADGELRLLIQNPEFKSEDAARRASSLSQTLFYKNTFDELALIDDQGREQLRISRLGVAPQSELLDRSQSPEFRAAMNGNRTYYGPVYASTLSGEPLMLASPTACSQARCGCSRSGTPSPTSRSARAAAS
jgi:Cache domain